MALSTRVQAFLDRCGRRERSPQTRANALAQFEQYGIQPCDIWIEFELQWGGYRFHDWQLGLVFENDETTDTPFIEFAQLSGAPCYFVMDRTGELFEYCHPETRLIAESIEVFL